MRCEIIIEPEAKVIDSESIAQAMEKLIMCLPLPPFFSLTIPKRQYKKKKK